ncbi:MAG: ATP synthase F0 subunit C [Thermoguttaceae bacterium]
MNKFARIAVVCFVLFTILAPAVAFAADDASAAASSSRALAYIGAGIGAGLTIIGGGYGISRIGAAALESMARQPELAGGIQTAMIIAAALVEGATLLAVIVCLLCLLL